MMQAVYKPARPSMMIDEVRKLLEIVILGRFTILSLRRAELIAKMIRCVGLNRADQITLFDDLLSRKTEQGNDAFDIRAKKYFTEQIDELTKEGLSGIHSCARFSHNDDPVYREIVGPD